MKRVSFLLLIVFAFYISETRPQGIAASTPSFTTFDVPAAGTGAFQGTGGITINSVGDIAGAYIVAGNVTHGFLRTSSGAITSFDAPNAGKSNNQGTYAASINTARTITGTYFDSNNAYHGYVRAASGTITQFDAPGAGTGGHRGTSSLSINTAGVITGFYATGSYLTTSVFHGFIRAANGTITSFDAPGAGTGNRQGTEAFSINSVGVIAGSYLDSNFVRHGFVRAANGTFTTFNAPGAGTNTGFNGSDLRFQGTVPVSINTAGVITGVYADANFARHGFVRAANGTVTSFDAPGASTAGTGTDGTIPMSINALGVIAGGFGDAGGVMHGFVRAANGTITTFDDPGAGSGAMFQGTAGTSINDSGRIAGIYGDPNNVFHGFLRTPSIVVSVSLAPAPLPFGNQVINTASATKKVTLTSTGTANLSVSSIAIAGANAGDFAQTNNCPATLAPAKQCAISVAFMPIQLGSRAASLTVTDNAANSPQTVSLTGAGVVAAALSPASAAYAAQVVGTTSAAKTFTLTNNQTVALTGIVISRTGDFAVSAKTCTPTLAAKSSCTISVTFTPTAAGARTGKLSVSDSAVNSPQTATLSGTGLAPATLTPANVTYAAQTVGTTSPAKTFTLTNNQSVALTSIVVSRTGDFAVSAKTCTATLAAKSTCTINVTFTPTAVGTRTGKLTVSDSAVNSPQTSSLTGTGK